ncbi:MAG: phosphotransferase [Pseudomonadota bacterium]
MTQLEGELTHNPNNAVTGSLQRIVHPGGGTMVRKVLNRQNTATTPVEWRASDKPRHWNYWQRESLVYESTLAQELVGSGVRLAHVHTLERHTDQQITLCLEDVQGRTGAELCLQDYADICQAWGCAQAWLLRSELPVQPWMSRGFLRAYTGSKPVDYALLNNARAWQQPLIADNWPQELQEALGFLYAHREALYQRLESAPQVLSHLDFWPNNVFVDSLGQVVLIDLGFMGAGALAEDIGNFIPDAIFDGFMPPENFSLLQDRLFDAYLTGLRDGGAQVDAVTLQSQLFASAVKYVWLGPLLLSRAGAQQQHSYGGAALVDANAQYRARGMTLLNLCLWAQQALGR